MNVFDLAARLMLDKKEYDKGLDDAEGKAHSIGSKIGGALSATAKAAGAAIAGAATAVSALTKQSVEAYANYEQLTGGVETLFGKSSDTVMKYAENAYKTAGLSANEYMETVTSFSASLLQSLDGDTAKAAQYADLAITDMSDNANKMGTSMEAIQNAYQGFAKQNYTMLDNLKLGYGGTKEEMERLLEDATAISGIEYDVSSYGDIVQAIHIIQENMGITGTTAKEASETISGSLAMTKSAWENLVTGISNPDADIGQLVGNLIDSAGIAVGNLLPTISNALVGIGQAVANLAPVLGETINTLFTDIAPQLMESASTLIVTLTTAIVENLPALFEAGVTMLQSLISGISDNLDTLIPAINEAILTIVETLGSPDSFTQLLEGAIQVITGIATGIAENLPILIPAVIDAIFTIAETLTNPENLGTLLDAAIALMAALAAGLVEATPRLIDGLVQVFNNVGTFLGEALGKVYVNIENWVLDLWDKFKTWGKDLIDNFIGGIKQKFTDIKNAFKEIGELIKSLIGFSEPEDGPLSNFHTYAPDMIDLFTKGIKENEGKLRRQMEESFNFSDVATSPEMQVNAAGIGMANAQGSSFGYSKGYNVEEDIHELLNLFRTGKARTGAEITNGRELNLLNG